MSQRIIRLGFIVFLISPSIGARTADIPQSGPAEIQRLIQQLGSESFQDRETASRNLAAIGEPARFALRKAMHDIDPEVRRRAVELVDGLTAQDRVHEVAALQGVWVLKTTEHLGQKADQDPVEDELEKLFLRRRNPAETRELQDDASIRRTTLAFKGSALVFRQWIVPFNGREGGLTSIEGTYHLDVDRNPKVMVTSWKRGVDQGEIQVGHCIYSVRSDTLLMCVSFNADPKLLPTKFATEQDADVVLLTYKREK
jgi:uncharacterized protein (TIGR03067 family)